MRPMKRQRIPNVPFLQQPIPKTQLAELMGVNRKTVYSWVQEGKLKGTTIADLLEYTYKRGVEDGREQSIHFIRSASPPSDKQWESFIHNFRPKNNS